MLFTFNPKVITNLLIYSTGQICNMTHKMRLYWCGKQTNKEAEITPPPEYHKNFPIYFVFGYFSANSGQRTRDSVAKC